MQFPDRTREIQTNREAARARRAKGDYAGARGSYFIWVESLRQQNINTAGQLEKDLEEAKQEYSDFVRLDPLYHQIRDAVIDVIGARPGILQTEMYKALSQFSKSDVQYAMYFSDDHGAIIRTKKGSTYSLSLP